MKGKRLLSWTILAGVAVVFAWLLLESWPIVVEMVSGAAWYALAGSVLLLLLANLQAGFLFASLTRRFGGPRFQGRQVVGVFLASQVAKYVPGRVWGVAMQAALLRAAGSTSAVVAANVELSALVLVVVSGVGLACHVSSLVSPLAGVATLLVTFGAGMFLLKMDGVARLARAGGKVMPLVSRLAPDLGHAATGQGDFPSKQAQASLAAYIALYLAGWWLLVAGVSRFDAETSLAIVAAMSLSYIIGMLSMLPGGLGAREGTMVLLAPAMGVSQDDMAALALVSRAVLLAVDVCAAAVGAWMLRKDYL